jgi:hypothetical protein
MLASTRPEGRHTLAFRVLIHGSRKKDIRAARDLILQLRSEVGLRQGGNTSQRVFSVPKKHLTAGPPLVKPTPSN